MIEEISYKQFCTLGGIASGRTFTQAVYSQGVYWYTRYFLVGGGRILAKP